MTGVQTCALPISRTAGDAIAHDLRSPLTRLRQKLEAALETPANSEADRDALRTALEIVGGTKVLCGPRHGVVGVENWNASVAARLGLGAPDLAPPGTPMVDGKYPIVTGLEQEFQVMRRLASGSGAASTTDG